MNIAIIGCGLIGQKRAVNLPKDCQLVACVDVVPDKANALAKQFPGAIAFSNWEEVIKNPSINIVIIATHHANLAVIGLRAVQAGKHVLMEKPAGRLVKELEQIITAKNSSGSHVHVGFNHRYHRAFRKARQLVDEGELGDLMFVRGRYGHGGRVGYETEWRAQPEQGGGELLDQGVHLIDLARWFLGDFVEVQGHANTYFWNMSVDDNSFLLLKTAKKNVAFLHASCTEWKNLFSFEIYGRKGKLDITGLGGSYGIERIAFYKMSPAMGPPETFIWEYPMTDDSWQVELNEFIENIKLGRPATSSIEDAHAALKIVEEIYKSCSYDYST